METRYGKISITSSKFNQEIGKLELYGTYKNVNFSPNILNIKFDGQCLFIYNQDIVLIYICLNSKIEQGLTEQKTRILSKELKRDWICIQAFQTMHWRYEAKEVKNHILKKYFKESIKMLFKLNKTERKMLKKDLKKVIKNNVQKYHTDKMFSRMEQDPLFKKYQAAGII